MAATQKDIAKKLNLSVSLVGKVLNDRPNVWASQATRDLIRHTAHEMAYQPHAAARALRRGKTNIVTFACLESALNMGGTVEALARSLSRMGYDLLVKTFADPATLLHKVREMAAANTCDAFVIWGIEPDAVDAEMLEGLKTPFVFKGHYEEEPNWFQIEFDHQVMMMQVVRHLADHGHRKIAFLGYDNDLGYMSRLQEGYRCGIREILHEPVRLDYIRNVGDNPRDAERRLEEWLRLPEDQQPTAIAMAAGNSAWRGIEIALARVGRRIGFGPGDMSVAGESHEGLSLLFGEAEAYSHLEVTDLAERMAEDLLIPLLCGKHPDPVVQVSPVLKPLTSFKLMDLLNKSGPTAD